MSRIASWDASTWIWAGLCGLMIVVGVLQLLGVGLWARAPERASGSDLRHGKSVDLGPSRERRERLAGLFFVVIGLTQLLTLRADRFGPGFHLAFGLVIAALGLWMLLFQPGFAGWRQRRYQARHADRIARGTDAYFEELREIEAYPPETVSAPMQRAFGALLVILGASQVALNFNR